LEGLSKSRRSSFGGEGLAMVVASKHKVMEILQGMQIHDIMCEGMVKNTEFRVMWGDEKGLSARKKPIGLVDC
jgi:hypothetical protein